MLDRTVDGSQMSARPPRQDTLLVDYNASDRYSVHVSGIQLGKEIIAIL